MSTVEIAIEIEDLKDQIENYEAQYENAKFQLSILRVKLEDARLEYEIGTTPEFVLADALFTNSGEGGVECDWDYDDWSNFRQGGTRDRYRKEALRILEENSEISPVTIIKIVRSL